MAESTKIVTPRHRLVLYEFTNWILFVAGIVNLGVGTWFAAQGDAAIAATSLTAGLVLLFAATIDRFESLKGLGIEAKTRKLNEKIEQADEALYRLSFVLRPALATHVIRLLSGESTLRFVSQSARNE